VAEERHLRLSDQRADGVNQLVQIGDELLDGHGRPRNRAVERLARAALIPIDDCEAPL
jgi:hypothetical protein